MEHERERTENFFGLNLLFRLVGLILKPKTDCQPSAFDVVCCCELLLCNETQQITLIV